MWYGWVEIWPVGWGGWKWRRWGKHFIGKLNVLSGLVLLFCLVTCWHKVESASSVECARVASCFFNSHLLTCQMHLSNWLNITDGIANTENQIWSEKLYQTLNYRLHFWDCYSIGLSALIVVYFSHCWQTAGMYWLCWCWHCSFSGERKMVWYFSLTALSVCLLKSMMMRRVCLIFASRCFALSIFCITCMYECDSHST